MLLISVTVHCDQHITQKSHSVDCFQYLKTNWNSFTILSVCFVIISEH